MTQPQIKRSIGPFTATSLVVANMIGAGILTTTGLMANHLPNPFWILFCWIFGGLIAMAGALCYAELGTRMPDEGGEYVYLKKLFHPVFGFLTGWTSLIVGFSVPIASSGLGFSEYMFAGLDFLLENSSYFQVIFKKLTAILIILFFTGIHYLGVKLGSRIQNILTAIKVVSVLGLASIGLLLGSGSWSNITIHVNEPFTGITIGTAMMFVMFSFSGWNASTYIAGELKNPKKSLPISLALGTVVVLIIYLAINFFILHSVPYSELKGNIAVLEIASVKAFGQWMGNGLSLLVGVALLSSLSAFIMIGPRVYFAMAKDGLFLSFAAKIHPKHKVPGRSILVQATIAVLMVTIGSYEQLIIYIGFALNIFPWLAILGLFFARKNKIGEVSAVKTWGYPFVPIFFLISSLGLMIVNFINRPVESSAAIITIVLGIPCYYIWIKRVKSAKSEIDSTQ